MLGHHMWGLFYSSVWLSKYLPTLHTNKNGVVINANKNNSLSKKIYHTRYGEHKYPEPYTL